MGVAQKRTNVPVRDPLLDAAECYALIDDRPTVVPVSTRPAPTDDDWARRTAEIRALVADTMPDDSSMAEALIAERRWEVAKDEEEARRGLP